MSQFIKVESTQVGSAKGDEPVAARRIKQSTHDNAQSIEKNRILEVDVRKAITRRSSCTSPRCIGLAGTLFDMRVAASRYT
jgi:hypothetical protein